MLKRHEPDMAYYAGARDAFVEMQKHLHKFLEKVAVYEAELMDDMAAAMDANAKSEEADK